MLSRLTLWVVSCAAFSGGCGGGDAISMNATTGGVAGTPQSFSIGGAGAISSGGVSPGGGSVASNTGQSKGVSCSNREPNCSSVAFGLCAGIQADEGQCLDWSKLGATACTSPTDCPGFYPLAVFPLTATVGPVVAVCVKAGSVQSSPDDATPEIGYCAGIQTAIDSSGAASCANQPCGGSGYCSQVQGANSASVVSCTWTL